MATIHELNLSQTVEGPVAHLAAPRLWLRLRWAAWRAASSAITADDAQELPLELASGSRLPQMLYRHPDLAG
ncbi:hypothetical protein Vqi01_59250 [Micromonospora qiuiae]|uniref:Uncharacterized protein n=1 Tax=Micromonospora qiuiae TaxID=502268 RepID=A0ABQ4JJH6_9ACTN|nr:hypothetical protein [Micromonospora qiuiae]GIJ30763.1 hypothetical protein Vqi01_59250 [Micromonospora qiuiae]